jgi:class 3 adenylate cyclase
MISESTYDLVKDRVKARFLAVTKVKGKEEGTRVYELIGFADQPAKTPPAPAMEVK